MLTFERVSELLAYDPATGVLTWKMSRRGGVKSGSAAGSHRTKHNGKTYMQVSVDGKLYLGHRLAWLLVHGEFPKQQIDHINGDGCDNRLINLREVSNAENGRNRRKRLDNTSGVAGVSWHRCAGKWQVRIISNETYKHLGLFENFDDAVAARKAAEVEFGYHPNHGSDRPL